MWKRFRQVVGTVLAVVTLFLAFGDAPNQLRSWKTGWNLLWSSTGVDWPVFWTGNGGRTVLVLMAIVVGLVAWDVPEQLWKRWVHRHDPKFVEEARRKKTRADVGQFLRRLYGETARFALGDAFGEAELIAEFLHSDEKELMRRLVAVLLIECRHDTERAIKPMLDAQHCQTDQMFSVYLQAWGELFFRYQTLILRTHEARMALGAKSTGDQYTRWIQNDAKFIAAMKVLEHMDEVASLLLRG